MSISQLSVSIRICPIISACCIFQLLKPLFDFNKFLWYILTETYQLINAVNLLETKIKYCTYSIGWTSNCETFITWLNTEKIKCINILCGWSISEDFISHQKLYRDTNCSPILGMSSDNIICSLPHSTTSHRQYFPSTFFPHTAGSDYDDSYEPMHICRNYLSVLLNLFERMNKKIQDNIVLYHHIFNWSVYKCLTSFHQCANETQTGSRMITLTYSLNLKADYLKWNAC